MCGGIFVERNPLRSHLGLEERLAVPGLWEKKHKAMKEKAMWFYVGR